MDNSSEAELHSLAGTDETPERTSEQTPEQTPEQTRPDTEIKSARENLPATLKDQAPSWIWRIGYPGTLILIPIAYVVLIGIVASLHQKKESRFGNSVLEVLQIAATVWPISFAAVLGPFLKTLALHSAERGSTLGALEFLLTSQTTASAFKNFFFLGSTHAWTIVIVVVWCLSPLGGQAAVRSLSLHSNTTITQMPAMYYLGGNMSDMNGLYNQSGDLSLFAGRGTRTDFLFDFRNNIAASFSRPDVIVSHANGSSDGFDKAVEVLGGRMQAARLGQEDLWRNVRIPYIELLPQYDPKQPEAWVQVPTDMVVPYASLIGIPIRRSASSRAGNSTVMLRSHYQTVSCGAGFNGSTWIGPGADKFAFNNVTDGLKTGLYQNTETSDTFPNLILDAVNNTALIEHISVGYPSVDTEPSSKLSLILAGYCGRNVFIQTCDLSTTYVDIEVKCTRLTMSDDLKCQANRVRHPPGYPISGNLTALSNSATLMGIVYELPFATAMYTLVRPSLLEMYMIDPPRISQHFGGGNLHPGCYTNYSSGAFEARFATALNTVIMAMYNSSVVTGGDGTSLENRNMMWKNATETWTEFTDSVYTLHKTWFPIWLLSTLVLAISAAANIGVRARIKAPDFLDSVAGLTRDSPFVEVSQRSTGESGSDRLQTLKRVEVRICDIESDADVGKIALTTKTDGRRLAWGRVYE